MMPNPLLNTSYSKRSMVESKTNNSTKNSNADLKHNNSIITKNDDDTKDNHAANNNSAIKNNNTDGKTNADVPTPAQGDDGDGTLSPHEAVQPSESQHSLNGNKVYKSGPLFLSSKGVRFSSLCVYKCSLARI
ncbi:hypothetical protein LXL04_029065 [Taraxacum kok-saghyz]